jgi:hypothetical protein
MPSPDRDALMNVRQRHLGRMREKGQPGWVRVYDDRVECLRPGVISRGLTETIRYEQVAQVLVTRGLAFSKLAVQSNGGGGFAIDGLKKDEADAAKELIDERVARYRADITTTRAPVNSGGLADQLTQLASLRESGALSEEEFQQAKARLMSDSS